MAFILAVGHRIRAHSLDFILFTTLFSGSICPHEIMRWVRARVYTYTPAFFPCLLLIVMNNGRTQLSYDGVLCDVDPGSEADSEMGDFQATIMQTDARHGKKNNLGYSRQISD
jgi:hypothetical protein